MDEQKQWWQVGEKVGDFVFVFYQPNGSLPIFPSRELAEAYIAEQKTMGCLAERARRMVVQEAMLG